MYKKGEYIIYGTSGVCLIEDIIKSPFGGSTTAMYYVLKPLSSPSGSTVFSPVDNKSVMMRSLMTESDIRSLREHAPALELICVANEKQRRDAYREAASSNEPENWVRIIRTVGERRCTFSSLRKRLPEVDGEFENIAKRCLYNEIALVLGTTYDVVCGKAQSLFESFFPAMKEA